MNKQKQKHSSQTVKEHLETIIYEKCWPIYIDTTYRCQNEQEMVGRKEFRFFKYPQC